MATRISVDGQDGLLIARSSGIRLVEENEGALVRVRIAYDLFQPVPT
jgi:hypothetical protein